jgi:hypothetical protein
MVVPTATVNYPQNIGNWFTVESLTGACGYMIHESVVRLLKAWKEKALQMESQAEQETGLKRERLLAMAQVLYGCEEDLRAGLQDEFLALAVLFVGESPAEPSSPPKKPDRS